MNRRTFVFSGAAALVAAASGTAVVQSGVLAGPRPESDDDSSASPPISTATVQRGDLAAELEFRASVTFGESWPINTRAAGTVTQRVPKGTVVEFGNTLAHIDHRPLYYAYGGMPMYRELMRRPSGSRDEHGNRLNLMNGFDVAHLQKFLIEAGFDEDGDLEMDGEFGNVTLDAVKAWQSAVGLPVSGRVDSSQLVFGPNPVRIADELRIGARFESLSVTEAVADVLVDTSNKDRASLPIGGRATVVLPTGTRWPAEVVDQEQVAAADGSRVWRTSISTVDPLPSDATTAQVLVTDIAASDVLHVPVGALLALAEGGFALEVVAGEVGRLRSVEVGAVIDGRAEVSGDVEVGDVVVVAS